MEKYSAYRDSGTGIQPFLNPVPPNVPTPLVKALSPIGYIAGTIKTALVVVVGVVYFFTVEIFLLFLLPLGYPYYLIRGILTTIFARLTLLLVGLWWIPTVNVMRKRGRGASPKQAWNPKAGDVIVSNWVSWVEILWLAFRFDPIFVLPIPAEIPATSSGPSMPVTPPTGRRTGTGSAAISGPVTRQLATKVPIVGYQVVSLWKMIRLTGCVPLYSGISGNARTLESIRKKASRPVVVFPECTTSNGRAMLRFSDAFGRSMVPIKAYNVFVMCARYDPPTLYTPTLTCSVPSTSIFHPLPHIFRVASSLSPTLSRSLSIRLLNPAESPSSPAFVASDVLSGRGYQDEMAEACSVLIAQIGKMKITGLGWEDKMSFLQFYRGKTRR